MADLRECLSVVPDPRHRRGVRHALISILVIAASAALTGARSFTAIGEWAADAPQQVLAQLGARFDRRRGRYLAPDEATVRRNLRDVDADALDRAIGCWLLTRSAAAEGLVVAVDGKTLHDTCDSTGQGVHLLAAMTHDGIVLAQRDVGAKTNEISEFQPLLSTMDLAGVVITANALHTQRGHARHLIERGADYVLTVKNNQYAHPARPTRRPALA